MPLGELAAVGSALLWALNSVLVRPLAQRLPALRITALQYLCSATCMLVTSAALGRMALVGSIPPEQALGLIFSALTGMGVGDTAYVRSLSTAGVSLAYPVSQAGYVLFTFAFSQLLLGEALTPRVLSGSALLLAGIILLSRAAPKGAAPSGLVVSATRIRNGLLMAVFAGFCWALTTTVLKIAIKDLDILAANSLRIPAVALVLNIVAGARYGLDYRTLGVRSIGIIALAGVVGMWCSSLLFLFAVQEAGAAKTAVLSSTSPLFASALAVLFLHERFSAALGAGTALAVAGMIVVV